MEEDWFKDEVFWDDFQNILHNEGRLSQTKEQVERFVELLELEKGAKVLDLCCGIGRHSLELARRGYDVTGVDLTEKYIEKARRNAEEEGLDVEFVRGDMRNFKRGKTYDGAINFFTSFGYFKDEKDNMKVLENVHSSLKEDGMFLLDVMGREIWKRIYSEKDWARLDDGYFLERRIIEGDWDLLKSEWILIKGGNVREGTFYSKLYSDVELKNMLERAGFSRVDIYGDLHGSKYNRMADRLIAVAEK